MAIAFGSYDPLLHRDAVTVGMVRYRCAGAHKRLTIGLTPGNSGSFTPPDGQGQRSHHI